MPTLSELPQTLISVDTDLALVERAGTSYGTTVAALREPMQPRLTIASGKLLGRVGIFPGGPEPVSVGTGLKLTDGVLAVDQATLPATNASSLNVVATGSTRSRTLAARAADRVNVLDFNARGDGVTNDSINIQNAIDTAAAKPRGGEVYFPPGTYRIDASVQLLRPRSKVVLRGAGRGRSVLFVDDAINAIAGDCITNALEGGGWLPLDDFHMRDLTVRGRADVARSAGAQMVRLFGTNLSVHDCEFMYSRNMGLVISNSDQVSVRGCRVYRTVADGIAVWDSSNVVIDGNEVIGANDDAISAHASSVHPAPLRSGIVIANNIITESQGIAVLGAKSVVITGNVLRRILGTGIRVIAPDVADAQGQTPQFAVRIANNIVADVFLRPEPNPRNAVQFYIWLTGGPRNPGGAAAAPGEPAVGSGAVAPLYGSGAGTFYAGESSNPAVAAPAGHWNDITGNQLVRTLPAAAAVSDWGYGAEGLWVGDNGDGSGFYNGPVSEAQLASIGILLGPALRNCRIAGNTIQTTGPYGILFNAGTYVPVTTRDMDYDGLTIEGNRIVDVATAAIAGPPNGAHRVLVRGNEIDGDPRLRAASRGAGGTWASATGLVGVLLSGCSGFVVSGNAFRNLATAVRQVGAVRNVVTANTLHGDPVAVGFSVANRGIGTMEPGGAGWLHVVETSDPGDAQYGRIKSAVVTSAAAMPTTGSYVTGHFVANTAPATANRQTLMGWLRLTTGSGHVAGTDWSAVYGADGGVLSAPKVTVFTATGAWVKDPAAAQVEVEVWGGGGAGGNGAVANAGTAISGGGGGGGGGKRRARFRAADLPGSVSVVVGAPGARGAGNGAAGGQGGASSFGTYLRAWGGGGGAGGSTTAAAGGGGAGDNSPGNNASGATAGTGGGSFGAAGGGGGAAGGSERVGGGGGAGCAAGGAGQLGGYAAEAGGGGGAGGGISAGNASFAGGGTPLFNIGGTNAGGSAPGGAGTAPGAFAYGQPASMGGPGGAASTSAPGGAGAAGQTPAGGGGGGGAAQTGQPGGLAGPGGGGLVIVYEW
ncbi:MAG: right-handed parallel beta-helix repeat-containing protein [Acetobacteraceae bacterium]|nr:right-handed parallel beta-helix repeat-containing protein [Acetobacteraceae bacterium]